MNKVNLKEKYMHILKGLSGGTDGKTHYTYSGTIQDIDNEPLFIDFGKLPYYPSFNHLNEVPFDFIALALLAKDKDAYEQFKAIFLERYRYATDVFEEQRKILRHTHKTSLVSMHSESFIPFTFNAYYKELASALVKTYNGLVLLLREVKGIETIEEVEKTFEDFDSIDEFEAYAFNRRKPPVIEVCTVEELSFSPSLFLSVYENILMNWNRDVVQANTDDLSGSTGHISDEEIYALQDEYEANEEKRVTLIAQLMEYLRGSFEKVNT